MCVCVCELQYAGAIQKFYTTQKRQNFTLVLDFITRKGKINGVYLKIRDNINSFIYNVEFFCVCVCVSE